MTGGIAATFTEDLRLLPDAEVVAVGSRSAESARAFADRHAHRRASRELGRSGRQTPTRTSVDAANTQNADYDAVRTCLEGGKAVLCEKAFTLNRAEAAKLVDLARERGLFLMEAMWTRCIPAIRKIMELVEGGAIGPVNTVHADFGFSVSVRPSTGSATRHSAAAPCSTWASTRSPSPTWCSALPPGCDPGRG